MLDALLPAAQAFAAAIEMGETGRAGLDAAARGSETGAAATAGMHPVWGRSSYLGERALGHPDPGASAVAILLRALAG